MRDRGTSMLYRAASRLEDSQALDTAVHAFDRAIPVQLRNGKVRPALSGRWLGHAAHPMLTDFPLGSWMSASLLDLVGGRQARPASRRLVGFGVLAALPTAVTGVSDWLSATPREQRVGVVHAATNSAALSLYTASWLARRRQRQVLGTGLALVGGAVATVGGFLGGHLTLARDTGRRATASAMGTSFRWRLRGRSRG